MQLKSIDWFLYDTSFNWKMFRSRLSCSDFFLYHFSCDIAYFIVYKSISVVVVWVLNIHITQVTI